MRKFIAQLLKIDWIGLAFQLGLALFIFVSFVRCTFER